MSERNGGFHGDTPTSGWPIVQGKSHRSKSILCDGLAHFSESPMKIPVDLNWRYFSMLTLRVMVHNVLNPQGSNETCCGGTSPASKSCRPSRTAEPRTRKGRCSKPVLTGSRPGESMGVHGFEHHEWWKMVENGGKMGRFTGPKHQRLATMKFGDV